MSSTIKGSLLVILSALGYGLMPLFSKIAYADGMSVNTLLFYRFLIASTLLWGFYAFGKQKVHTSWGHKGYLALLGLIGYAIPSITLFIAYGRLHSSIATLILFVHPIFVVLFETLFFKSKMNISKGVSVALTAFGLWIILAEPDLVLDIPGVILSFIAAITYGIYCLGLYEKKTKATSTLYVTAFVLTSCCIVNAALLLPTPSQFLVTSLTGWGAILALSIVGTLIPAIAFNKGLKLIGPGSATVISTIEPVFVALVGSFVLGEAFTFKLFIGGIIILLAITLVHFQPSSLPEHM